MDTAYTKNEILKEHILYVILIADKSPKQFF